MTTIVNLMRRARQARSAAEASRNRQQLRQAAQRAFLHFPRPYRLHLGCGDILLDRWVNIDLDNLSGKADLQWDLTWGIPVEDGSCELIYSEHLVEHLTAADGVALMKECRRVLQPGGILRIAMPSLEVLIRRSCCGDWRDQDWLRWPGHDFIQTRAEMMNIAFRWWGHQWLYDYEELDRRLREAGWEEITPAERGQSDCAALRNLETRADSMLICEARK
jgi:predicted SAM-dependent methyltransferase